MLLLALWLQAAAPTATITTKPETPLLSVGRTGLELQCDLIIENPGDAEWRLDELAVDAYAGGKPVSLRRLGANGTGPSIETVPGRTLAPNGKQLLFNPFWSFDDVAPDEVRFRLTYTETKDEGAREMVVEKTVRPQVYTTLTPLVLPLKGRALVWDGHDFLSHHRRLNFAHPALLQMGVKNNALRYAYDLSVADEQGRMFKGEGRTREDWYGWETPVRSPGDGTVVEVQNAVKDHQVGENPLTIPEILANPRVLAGNYVVIDHGRGEYSLLAHFRQGSPEVKVGDKVKQGQVLGKMGFSGDAFTVHTHYELRRGVPFDVEGLPSVFSGVSRLVGDRRVPAKAIDTGDLVVAE